jgi:hypothetical protein
LTDLFPKFERFRRLTHRFLDLLKLGFTKQLLKEVWGFSLRLFLEGWATDQKSKNLITVPKHSHQVKQSYHLKNE